MGAYVFMVFFSYVHNTSSPQNSMKTGGSLANAVTFGNANQQCTQKQSKNAFAMHIRPMSSP